MDQWTRAPEEIRAQIETCCQKNAWLKRGGIDFEDGFLPESDYPYPLVEAASLASLAAFFTHGNWPIRQGIRYKSLAFVNQVNGGDEWWTLKNFTGEWVDFESITFPRIIDKGEFRELIAALEAATREQWLSLTYNDQPRPKEATSKPNKVVKTEYVTFFYHDNPVFADFVEDCLARFRSDDLGDLTAKERQANTKNYQLGRYFIPKNIIVGGEKELLIVRSMATGITTACFIRED